MKTDVPKRANIHCICCALNCSPAVLRSSSARWGLCGQTAAAAPSSAHGANEPLLRADRLMPRYQISLVKLIGGDAKMQPKCLLSSTFEEQFVSLRCVGGVYFVYSITVSVRGQGLEYCKRAQRFHQALSL